MCERRKYITPMSEFVELEGNVFTASCETRWSDTGQVVVDDGFSIFCGCTNYAGHDYTKQNP